MSKQSSGTHLFTPTKMANLTSGEKLARIRQLLAAHDLEGYLITSADAHQSEYVSSSEKRKDFISNFTGSAGTVLITRNQALLWTDGRYFNQATQELSSDWTLMRAGMKNVPTLNEWILQNIPKEKKIGVDAYLISAAGAHELIQEGISLTPIDQNLVDIVWGAERPSPPTTVIRHHPLHVSGQSSKDKVSILQQRLKELNRPFVVISMLDEIAWLLNIRGSDIEYNPVVRSYVVIPNSGAIQWFLPHDISREMEVDVRNHLQLDSSEAFVVIRPYEEIESYLKSYTSTLASNSSTFDLSLSPSQLNWRLYAAIENSLAHNPTIKIKSAPSLITKMKSIKNEAELNGMRQCHVRDGAALTAYFAWLDRYMKDAKDRNLPEDQMPTEYDVAQVLETYRQKVEHYISPSFATISSYGPNGAVIHYKPKKETSLRLGYDSLYLCDSGGQYMDGTTDVTRTLHFGEPTQRMKDCFTLVLKGHIALAQAIFPEGILGYRLDTLARVPLWQVGLDYNHGTGHGVGAHLNVHEGPQGIGARTRGQDEGFVPGMTTSNEPGYYEDGNFGIRIENICITIPAATPNSFNTTYCCFETITLCPIQLSLLSRSLLTPAEVEWINTYHRQVREKLLPIMRVSFPEAVGYLEQQTIELV